MNVLETKAVLGGTRFQLLPNGAGPSKVACGCRKMRHLLFSTRTHCLKCPLKKEKKGLGWWGSHGKELGICCWPLGHP